MKRNSRLLLIIIVILFVARFVNFTLFWNFQKSEILEIKDHWEKTNQLSPDDLYYEPLGFSNYRSSKKKMTSLKNDRPENVIVLHFFNLVHQSVFLIHNNNEKKYIPLSGSWYEFEKGDTEIFYYMFDFGIKKDHLGIKREVVETTGSLLSIIKDFKTKNKNFNQGTDSFSVITGEWPGFDYFKKIYACYFYFPLILIVVMRFFFSNFIFISFFYYFEMLVLFNYQYFLKAPLEVFPISNNYYQLTSKTYIVVMVAFYSLFILGIILGFLKAKKRDICLTTTIIPVNDNYNSRFNIA